MKIVKLSDHALMKLKMLQEHGLHIDLDFIEATVYHPEKLVTGYAGRKIAQGRLDADHVLRVVYAEHNDNLVVVTLYPARREKYEKDQV